MRAEGRACGDICICAIGVSVHPADATPLSWSSNMHHRMAHLVIQSSNHHRELSDLSASSPYVSFTIPYLSEMIDSLRK